MKLPIALNQVTPAWLTEQLQANGRLNRSGCVTAISLEPNPVWNVAETAFLTLEGTQLGSLPIRLFAKLTRSADALERFMPGEHAFYSSSRASALPVPCCYLALRDEETGGSLILLEDLRETHRAVDWPHQPSFEECELAVETLAATHAGTLLPQSADVEKMVQREVELNALVSNLLPGFLDIMGDALSVERRGLVERALDRYASLKAQRYRSGRDLCISQGDSHVWNFLYPRDPAKSRCVLIDWEYWFEDFGATDLALMMALFWYPERRKRFEKALLRRYFEAMDQRGPATGSFDQLTEDYRIAHICNVIVPVYQSVAGDDIWWSNLERWFLSLDDLEARDLL